MMDNTQPMGEMLQLREQRDQLKTELDEVTKQRDELQLAYNNLTESLADPINIGLEPEEPTTDIKEWFILDMGLPNGETITLGTEGSVMRIRSRGLVPFECPVRKGRKVQTVLEVDQFIQELVDKARPRCKHGKLMHERCIECGRVHGG